MGCPTGTPVPCVVPTPWYGVTLPFTPSTAQLTRYAQHREHDLVYDYREEPPRVTFDKDALPKLIAKYPQDPVYALLGLYREVERAKGTYVDGMVPDAQGRIHGAFNHNPSTLRLAMKDPSLQTIPRGRKDSVYNDIKKMFVARPGHMFIEADFCVDPHSKILRSDLTWAEAQDVRPGDELIGFDETLDSTLGVGKGNAHQHKYRAATVKAVRRIRQPRYRVVTTQGTTTVSADHRFVARNLKQRRRWVHARDLKPGMRMAFLSRPWEVEQSRDAGYLAGFFDGEGWVHRTTVGFGQNPGLVLEHVQGLLRERGFAFRVSPNNSTVHCEIVTGEEHSLSFLGRIRPKRLLAKSRAMWEGRRTWSQKSPVATVVSVEALPVGDVIAIETTTGTFISDGFFSHNCGIEAVLVYYLAGDPTGVRLALTDIHSFFTSHVVGEPADLTWETPHLNDYLKYIKKKHKDTRQVCKATIHGSSYGVSPYKIHMMQPDLFPDTKTARYYQDAYFALFPSLRRWQWQTCVEAEKQGFLTAPDGFRQYFPAAMRWAWNDARQMWEMDYGPQKNEALAAVPQHMGMSYLARAANTLFHEHFEAAGQYLRLLIHDSILLEVPTPLCDTVRALVEEVMRRPHPAMPLPPSWGLGTHLSIDVESKQGDVWATMT